MFTNENPTIKIGFTKFTQLRPKDCILAGPTGTHNVCVCMIHENVRLMCKSIAKITGIRDGKEYLNKISCTKLFY